MSLVAIMLAVTALGLACIVILLWSENAELTRENTDLRSENGRMRTEIRTHYVLRATVENLLSTYEPDPEPKGP